MNARKHLPPAPLSTNPTPLPPHPTPTHLQDCLIELALELLQPHPRPRRQLRQRGPARAQCAQQAQRDLGGDQLPAVLPKVLRGGWRVCGVCGVGWAKDKLLVFWLVHSVGQPKARGQNAPCMGDAYAAAAIAAGRTHHSEKG